MNNIVCSDTRHQTPDTRHQTPDTRHQTPDTRHQTPLIYSFKDWLKNRIYDFFNFIFHYEFFRRILCGTGIFKNLELKTIYDYCVENNSIIKLYDDSKKYPSRILCKNKTEFENGIEKRFEKRNSYYIYVSKIKDCLIFSNRDFIIKDNFLLSDKVFINLKGIQSLFYLEKSMVFISGNQVLNSRITHSQEIKNGILLTKLWSKNNFHFTFEAMARLQLVDEIQEYRSWPILIDEHALENPWNVQLLEMVNIYKHPVILIKGHVNYLVHELIYPSMLTWGNSDEIKKGYAPSMHKMAAEYIRECILKVHKPKKIYKNVYIARGDNARLLNEPEVIKFLENHGFEIINPNFVTYSDFLDCFMTADNIIGVTGTGMINMILTKKTAKIFIICPFEFQHDQMIAVADAGGRNFEFIPAEINKHGPVLNKSNFHVKIEKIESLIQSMSIS